MLKLFSFQVKNIEKFALILSNHFLRKYPHVVATKINIEEYPWKRVDIVSFYFIYGNVL
jgi:urate oxidase